MTKTNINRENGNLVVFRRNYEILAIKKTLTEAVTNTRIAFLHSSQFQ